MLPIDTYLLNQVQAASPEELHVLLLSAFERHLQTFITAIERKDFKEQQQLSNKLSDIIEILVQQTSDAPDELMINLRRIYAWWFKELCNFNSHTRVDDLIKMRVQVNDIKTAWFQSKSR